MKPMTKIGLICDRIRWDEKALIKAASKAKVDLALIDPKEIYIGTSENPKKLKAKFGEVAIQRCISYFRGLHITAILENSGLQIVNPFNVSLTCGNKLFATLALEKAGIPVPRTVAAFTEEGVTKALEDLGFPAVLKPVVGSWGRLIALIRDKEAAQAIVESREQMNNALLQIYYLQEYVKRPPRDIRILVIGDQSIAASYRYSPMDDWRTNVARGGKSEQCEVTAELEDIAVKAANAVGGGVLAVDCMESPKGILVHEVNSTVEFRGLYSTTKVDIPREIINYAVEVKKK
jgi:[lysine-biosynthesis-protein LysW]--L-2-aminoadipate ligase